MFFYGAVPPYYCHSSISQQFYRLAEERRRKWDVWITEMKKDSLTEDYQIAFIKYFQ